MIPEQDLHITITHRHNQWVGTYDQRNHLHILHKPTGLYVAGFYRPTQGLDKKAELLTELEALIQHHYGPITEDPR